jgi:hypothetical protein
VLDGLRLEGKAAANHTTHTGDMHGGIYLPPSTTVSQEAELIDLSGIKSPKTVIYYQYRTMSESLKIS